MYVISRLYINFALYAEYIIVCFECYMYMCKPHTYYEVNCYTQRVLNLAVNLMLNLGLRPTIMTWFIRASNTYVVLKHRIRVISDLGVNGLYTYVNV